MSRELDTMKEIERDQAGMDTVKSATVVPQDGGQALVGDGGVLGLSRRVAEAVEIKALLEQNTDEVANLVRALDGSYVKPGVGGERYTALSW